MKAKVAFFPQSAARAAFPFFLSWMEVFPHPSFFLVPSRMPFMRVVSAFPQGSSPPPDEVAAGPFSPAGQNSFFFQDSEARAPPDESSFFPPE